MLLFLPLGWLAIAWVRYLYDRKWFSRPSLVLDSMWLFETLMAVPRNHPYEVGPGDRLGFSVFAVYKVITWIGLRPLATAAAGRLPARLLLLRTFGFRPAGASGSSTCSAPAGVMPAQSS